VRLLAQRGVPDRRVIDLKSQAPPLLKPETFHIVANVEDRRLISADQVPLFERAGWRKEP